MGCTGFMYPQLLLFHVATIKLFGKLLIYSVIKIQICSLTNGNKVSKGVFSLLAFYTALACGHVLPVYKTSPNFNDDDMHIQKE